MAMSCIHCRAKLASQWVNAEAFIYSPAILGLDDLVQREFVQASTGEN
jgi:hypothetical protein